MSDEADADEPMTFEEALAVVAEIHQRRKKLWIAKYGEPTPRISFKVQGYGPRPEVSGSSRRPSRGAPDDEDAE